MRVFSLSTLVVGLALSGIFTACVPDQDQDQWKAKKVDEEISKLQGMVGVFQGQAVSERDGSPLGQVTLKLETDRKTQFTSGNYKPDEQAVLKGTLTYQGTDKVVLVFQEGFYDTSRGFFKATVPVAGVSLSNSADSSDGSGSSKGAQVEISGTVSGDSLDGFMEAVGFPDGRGRLHLSKTAQASPEGLSKDGKGTKDTGRSPVHSFGGNAKFTLGDTRPVQLLVLDNKVKAEEKFIDLLKPSRTVQATLKLSERLQVLFADAELDQLAGTLVGRSKLTRGMEKYELGLNCRTTATQGWNCAFLLNEHNGTVGTAVLEANTDASRGTGPLVQDYTFFEAYEGHFSQGEDSNRFVTMSLVGNPLSSEEEFNQLFLGIRKVVVGVTFDNVVNLSFIDATWDQIAGTMSGRLHLSQVSTGEARDYALDCVQKSFPGNLSGWSCRFASSYNGLLLGIDFLPRKAITR